MSQSEFSLHVASALVRVFTLFAAMTEKGRPSLQEAEQRKKLLCTKFYFFIIAALHSRCGHYILQLWFLSFFLLVPFFAYSQRSQSRCLPYFHTGCGPSSNLECMSELCCTRLAKNRPTGRKNRQKIAICAPSQNFVGLYLRK